MLKPTVLVVGDGRNEYGGIVPHMRRNPRHRIDHSALLGQFQPMRMKLDSVLNLPPFPIGSGIISSGGHPS